MLILESKKWNAVVPSQKGGKEVAGREKCVPRYGDTREHNLCENNTHLFPFSVEQGRF